MSRRLVSVASGGIQGRQVLIEEMGVEPGPELRQAQEAILRLDPALARPVKAAPRMPRQLP
ncbi:hypothetical protein AB0K16_25225 [Nonomuraea jabiensis]|uniref:hypothetical protein n=1 Tax=Nonomuraea jabiensis TaxID=882448 RepID=UPI003413D1A6